MNSSDIFGRAFENLRAGVLLLEQATGLVMEANPAFLRISGRSRGEVVGRNFWTPPLIDDAEVGGEVFAHLRAGGPVEDVELPLQTGDGSCLLLELSGREVGGGVVQIEVRDATPQAGARLAERMDAQRALATRVAAEFTGMHRALQAAGELLGQCAKRGQSTFLETDEVRKAADAAGGMARELLAYSGQLTLVTGRVQLNELILDMQPALQQLLGRRVEFVADLGRDAAAVLADPAQVRQILLKLAANSAEAMERGGKFRVATRNASSDDPALGGGVGGAYVMLEVSDQGPGLDDASWEHLYEPFFTTKQHGKRGLGLAAVHGIVRQMGGRLWAHSEPGTGACFRIYLRRAEALATAPAVPAECRGPATILLMEQNDGLRTVMSNILKKRGYRVLAAGAASEALQVAKTEGPADLLIGEPEPDLVKRLTGRRTKLRTLCLDRVPEGTATAILPKPFELDDLLGKVRELLEV